MGLAWSCPNQANGARLSRLTWPRPRRGGRMKHRPGPRPPNRPQARELSLTLRPGCFLPQTRCLLTDMHRLVLVASVTAALTGAAGAQDSDGRYQLSPTSDGFLKLDSRSGA